MVCKSNRDFYYFSITSVRKYGCVLQNSVSKQSVWFKTRWLTLSFDTRYFPKVISSSGNCSRVFLQVAASQMCNFPNGILPNVRLPKQQLTKGQAKHSEASQAATGTVRQSQARTGLGSWRLENCTFGKCSNFGKCLTPIRFYPSIIFSLIVKL